MTPKCEECGGKDFFWHCNEGWGVATCNTCKTPTWFPNEADVRPRRTNMTKPKKIAKNYDSLRKAERYQNRLYGKYESVKLVLFPVSSESGKYVWEVR